MANICFDVYSTCTHTRKHTRKLMQAPGIKQIYIDYWRCTYIPPVCLPYASNSKQWLAREVSMGWNEMEIAAAHWLLSRLEFTWTQRRELERESKRMKETAGNKASPCGWSRRWSHHGRLRSLMRNSPGAVLCTVRFSPAESTAIRNIQRLMNY